MPQTLDMACIALEQALKNTEACKRYTIMHNAHYEHPGWVKLQKDNRRNLNENSSKKSHVLCI